MEEVVRELQLPSRQCKALSTSRNVCLVSENWLKAIANGRLGSLASTVWPSLTEAECNLLLAPSNSNLTKPWIRISIRVIQKRNTDVLSLVEEPLCNSIQSDNLFDLLAYIHRESFCQTWRKASNNFKLANVPPGIDKSNNVQKHYNELVRKVLQKVMQCRLFRLNDGLSEDIGTVSSGQHPNINEAYCVIESDSNFFVLQPYHNYSLHDCVTFSPSKLSGSYAKPLFVIFQLLQAIHQAHLWGFSVGDLTLSDLLLDRRLWLRLNFPKFHGLYKEIKPSIKSSCQTCTDLSEGRLCIDSLAELVQQWVGGELTNYDYLMFLNHLAGRRCGDPNHHPVLPWVIDFTKLDKGYRDLSKSKFRLNKGDHQLDLTYDTSHPFPGDSSSVLRQAQVPHHISDVLSDITYYVYMARRTPKSVLCTYVRSKWVPNEYPSSMQRMQEWTPDECIPEFFTDANIFKSIHDDLPDLEVPSWAKDAEDFVEKHRAALESDYVSARLHQWIDLTFGYKLSGSAAVKAKNVCLQLVNHHTQLFNYGVVQLFNQPHPPRQVHAVVATRVPPLFRRPPYKVSERIERETLQDRKLRTQESLEKSSNRPENKTIVLPKGYDPTATLEQLERLYSFTTRATYEMPNEATASTEWCGNDNMKEELVSRDMQVFGCLLVELFMSPRLRILGMNANLEQRYSAIRGISSCIADEIPRPVKSCVEVLLQLQKPWKSSRISNLDPLFSYESVSDAGLPPPSCQLLLHPMSGLIYFPSYFPALYSMLSRLKAIDHQIACLSLSEQLQNERMLLLDQFARDRITILSKFVPRMSHHLGKEGLEILIPYVVDLFEDPSTSIQAVWSLFNPVSQALGPRATAVQLLPHLTLLFDAEFTTMKHMKLYHRSFVIQLLVRLGMDVFLNHFSTLLIEACAGFKNFVGTDENNRQFQESDFFNEDYGVGGEYPEVFVDPVIDTEDGSHSQPLDSTTDEQTGNSSMGEEVFPDDMSLDGQEDLKPPNVKDRSPSDSSSIDFPADDTQSVSSIGNSQDVANDDVSTGSAEPSEDMLSRSVGRLSVHSVSRLIHSDNEKNQESDASVEEESQTSSKTQLSSGSLQAETAEEVMNGTPTASPSVMRSEAEEFTSSLINNAMGLEYNISDVAAETIKWLSHRLGPVLTAKYLSRNLLRMLALCYLGEEQLEPSSRKDHWMPLSATQKYVIGDSHASQVLECLACIAVLYGQHIILLHYFQHLRELLAVAQKRLTVRAEASLLGCAALISHIIPYLSDTTLMDILKDTIFNDLVFPLLKLLCDNHVSFPSGSLARRVLSYKIIDILYIISLRIGFEMTREHMTIVLQKFFAAFNKVYDESFQKSDKSMGDESANQARGEVNTSNEGEVYFEIKVDSETKEYTIGTAVMPEPSMAKHQRQESGTFKYSLLLPQDEKVVDEVETPSEPTNQERIYQELLETFTPELAHNAYIPFCKLAGGIHMEQNLINDDLIRKLCALHDEAVSMQRMDKMTKAYSTTSDNKDGTGNSVSQDDENIVSGNFGSSVSMTGNKIMIHSVDSDDAETVISPKPVSNNITRPKSDSAIDFSRVKSPEMEINKQRHLKGNWLAYWEHEIGLSERESSFNFKQIKLQTFAGHSNSVRSLCVLDNENSFFSASKDKTVKLWSLRNSGDGNNRIGCQWTYSRHKKSVFAVAFLEGQRVAASCDGIVHTWDPFVGMNVRQYESPRNIPVTVMMPMPAPIPTLLTATTDAALRFLDLRSGSYYHEFKCTTGPAGLIRCIACSSDNHWVAVGYSSGVISLLDVRTGVLFASWKGHEGEILQMRAFNNKSLVTSSFDQCMALWNVEDAKLVCHFKGPTEPVHCFNFFHNEIISATTGNRIGVHTSLDRQASFSSSKLRAEVLRGVLTTMSVLPMNRLLLLGTDNGSIRLLA